MKHIILMAFTIGILLSCDDDDNNREVNRQDFLVFGHFYGECGGEECVETFKLTSEKLFEDTVDDYLNENFDFVELGDEKFQSVNDLNNFFPNELLDEDDAEIGCPDCADGGGLFIQYSENGIVRSWRIDQVKSNVPEYLHDFIDRVNAKIQIIND